MQIIHTRPLDFQVPFESIEKSHQSSQCHPIHIVYIHTMDDVISFVIIIFININEGFHHNIHIGLLQNNSLNYYPLLFSHGM